MFEYHGKFGWLQMFSDGGEGGGGTPASEPAATAPAVPAGGPPTPTIANPLLQDIPGQAAATPQAPAVETLNFGGREVEMVHPVLRDLHRDYSELNRTFTQTSQQAKLLETQNAQLQQMLQTVMPLVQQQTPQAQEPEGPTPEDIEAQKEAFLERFYDDPIAAVEQRAKQIVEQMLLSEVRPVIEPIRQQQNFQEQVSNLSQKYPDFKDTVPQMQSLLQAAPHLEQTLSMEQVYLTAKSVMMPNAQTPAAPTTETAADPLAAAKAQLLTDATFKQQIFNEMLTQHQQQNAQIPQVMGNQAGGATPTIPQSKPKTLREGSKAALEYFKNIGNMG